VEGYGKALGNGGRYDHIGDAYGRSRPATGFAFDLTSLTRWAQFDLDNNRGICFSEVDDIELLEEVDRLRADGERLIQIFPGQMVDYGEMNCDRKLVRENGELMIKPMA